MPKDKEIKVEFAPGCFDNWDGTQEELDEMVAEIKRMADTGEIFEGAEMIDDPDSWDLLPEEIKSIVIDEIDKSKTTNTRH